VRYCRFEQGQSVTEDSPSPKRRAQPDRAASVAMASRTCAECMADVAGETAACRRCERPLDSPPPRRKQSTPGVIVASIGFGIVLAVVVSLLIRL
jgi:hypothetical protein